MQYTCFFSANLWLPGTAEVPEFLKTMHSLKHVNVNRPKEPEKTEKDDDVPASPWSGVRLRSVRSKREDAQQSSVCLLLFCTTLVTLLQLKTYFTIGPSDLPSTAVTTIISIFWPHRSTTYIDAVYCYQPSSVVSQSVCRSVM